MKQQGLQHFFTSLAQAYPYPARIYLLGGAAALLMGGNRPTLDVDFEVDVGKSPSRWQAFDAAIQSVGDQTGIQAQYSQSVERWSMVTLLDWRKHAKLHQTYGKIKVYVASPPYWGIGKISRFIQQDCEDLLNVFSIQKPDSLTVAQIWYRALRESPLSSNLHLVRKNMVYFFKQYGRKIWGKDFPLDKVLALFG